MLLGLSVSGIERETRARLTGGDLPVGYSPLASVRGFGQRSLSWFTLN